MQRGAVLAAGLMLTLVAALASAGSIRVRMSDLHAAGGVPPGWTFTIPSGDPAKGKEVFTELECYSCHIVEAQGFPDKATDKEGPQLTGMGSHHPAEYFAQAILDPNAVLLDDVPDWIGADGRSKMPSYNDSLTLEEWVDLVAYLKSLTGGARRHDAAGGHDAHAGHEMHGPERDKTVGEYRVRLDYAEPEQENRPGYLTVSIADAASGQAIPYLPVSLRIGSGKALRSVKLAPVLTAAGPRYAASMLVPDETERVTVLVGAATVRVQSDDRGRYRTPRQVSFAW